MPIANGIVYGKDAKNDYAELSSQSQLAHNTMVNAFTESNMLYSKSSVIEDIVLNKFLSIYNTARSINFSNILRKNYILESFTSQDYVDLKFPVDDLLNLDIQNGSLTLPVNKTVTLDAESIIIEAESNGQAGNSYAYDYSNADPKVILTADNATLFEYEKVSNIFSTSTLYFSASIKLKAESITNGCYIRLYSEDGNNYPVIDSVDISLDGKDWYNVNKVIDVNKGDFYIRFMPRKIRHIRVRLKQENYNVFKTSFGPKYRYVIGIREISAKQTSYKTAGEYISIPFASRKIINGVAFNSDEVSFNDITYFVSANNGAKWVPVKDGKTLDMSSEDMGMRGEIDITQVRVKVKMDRVRSPNSASLKEYIVTNTTDQYFLKYTPISVKAMLGNHISFGTTQPYSFFISNTTGIDPAAMEQAECIAAGATIAQTLFYIPYRDTLIDEAELRMNGALLKNDTSIYNFIPHANPEHSIIVMKSNLLDQIQSATVDMIYKPFVYDHRYSKITGSRIVLPQSAFIESQEGITIEQVNYNPVDMQGTNIAELFDNDPDTTWTYTLANSETSWTILATHDKPFPVASYSITPFVDANGAKWNPGKWTLWGSDTVAGPWAKLDTQERTDAFWMSNEPMDFPMNNKCLYAAFKIVIDANCVLDLPEGTYTQQEIDANAADKKKLKLVNVNFYDATVVKINDLTQYQVIPKTATENTVIKLSDAVYNPDCDYRITYLPSVQLDSYMPPTWKDNAVSLQSLHKPPTGSKICFEYNYEDSETIKDIDFYTPVCHEYRVELL